MNSPSLPPPSGPPTIPTPAAAAPPSVAHKLVESLPDLLAIVCFFTLAVTRSISGELSVGLIVSICTGRLFPRLPGGGSSGPPSAGGGTFSATGLAVLVAPVIVGARLLSSAFTAVARKVVSHA